MKSSLLALVLALPLTAACRTSGQYMNDHWSDRSVTPRVSRYFLGYDAEKDGDYRDFQWRRKQDVNLTLRRYFLNHNPDNPHQRDVASRYQPRPNHSLFPNPVRYIHVEGLLLGAAVGFPLPIDSILGTLEPGGVEEFVNGVGETVRPVGVVAATAVGTWIAPPVEAVTGGESTSSYSANVVTQE